MATIETPPEDADGDPTVRIGARSGDEALAEGDLRPPRREPAPLFRAAREERIEGSFLVTVRAGADPPAVAARHGIEPTDVAEHFNRFYAEMTDAQVESVRFDPDTENVAENHGIYPA